MKYRSKANPDTIVEAFYWDPQTQPKKPMPAWLTEAVDSGELVIESTDAISLPFPAMGSVYPGDYIVKIPGRGFARAAKMMIEMRWEPVQE